MFRRILIPTDGSDITAKAVATAISLAGAMDARLYTLCVKEPFIYATVSEIQPVAPQEFFNAQQRVAERRLTAVKQACDLAGMPCDAQAVEALHPWEAIIDHAKRNECDLIVMASHGRRGVAALLLGSETQKVLTHTDVAVLVVR
jgi:nucleotide-binding universal stress UspA family protein